MSDSSIVSLEGKVVLIVGGTSGLGYSAAMAAVKAGARVVITGRDPEKLQRALLALGERGVGLAGNATNPEVANDAVALAVAAFGRLDALYHVAGGSGRSQGDGRLHEVTDAGIDYTIDLNLKGLIYSNRAAINQFLYQGTGGVVLNMGSVLGWSPSPDFFASHVYAATKSAVIGFTKALASYYSKDGIRANVVAPALVETPMARRAAADEAILAFIRNKQPLDGGRIGRPDDLDAAVLYLLSPASRFVTGQVLAVDGGWSLSEGRERI